MSSDSDRFVVQRALDEEDTSSLFQAKRWTNITDTSSSGGVFGSGQLQFDLCTLSSQNQWTDLSQAYVQFPVKLTITGSTALDSIDTSAACIKNGFHNLVDSVQLVLGGSTVQTSQIYQNVHATYKILTEWSQDELRKFGPSLGVALDDYKKDVDAVAVASGDSLDNVSIDTLSPALAGITYPPATNTGYKQRVNFMNTNASTAVVAGAAVSILTNMDLCAKGMAQVDAAATSAAGPDSFVCFYLATIRLKDISPVCEKLPPVKSLKGFMYINYNAATSTYTSTAAAGTVKTSITNTAQYGRCQPAMLDRLAVKGDADSVITFKCELSGIKSTNLTAAKPPITNARLYCPYYVASPEVDRLLTQKKTIRYNERFTTVVNIAKLSSTNTTITPGVANPKRITMLPLLTGAGANAAGLTAFQAAPELSPFDIVPCGSSPFAALQQLQIQVGNQPMFQEPVNMDHQMFMNEIAQQGLDGGQNNQQASGLLGQRLWNQMYRFYTCDIGRRVNGDDGASKSVQLSCYNPCNADMRIIVDVEHEKEISVDTAMGFVQQGF